MSPAGKGAGDGFAARWSRLKRESRAAETAEPAGDAPAPEADPKALQAEADATAAEKTDAEILEELELPDPDAMTAGDDFSAFMSPKVPTRLRNRALRQLWRSNPVLANLDRLNDYDDDFTAAATAGQVVKTAYQVGRGFIDKAAALLEEGAGDSPETPGPKPAAEPAAEEAGAERIAAAPPADPGPDRPPAAEVADSPENPAAKPRKSMRFSFDDDAA